MRMKSVILIGPMPPPRGGVSMHLSRLLRKSKGEPGFVLRIFDIRRLRLHSPDGSTSNIFIILKKVICADVVHVHISRKFKLQIVKAARCFGKKVLYTHHNSRNLSDPLTRETMRIAHSVILVRAPDIELPKEIMSKCDIIPAYIEETSSGHLPEELLRQFSSDKILLAHCYQKKNEPLLIEGKDLYGFDLIFDAIAILEGERKTSGLILFLADPADAMKDFYKSRIEWIGEHSGVKLIYWDKELDFSSALRHCSVLIRATRSDGDAISVREALNAGVPVLASDCVERPEGVIAFTSGNAFSLANTLAEILDNPDRKPFPQPDYTQEIFRIYRSLLISNA